jgi:hypothetical protein
MRIDHLSLEKNPPASGAQLQVIISTILSNFLVGLVVLYYVHMKATNRICGKALTKLGNIFLSGAILLFPPYTCPDATYI